MSETEDGGPAFPTKGPPHKVITAHGEHYEDDHHGLSLRDWFAGRAISGVLADTEIDWETADFSSCARYAYDLADAMLAVRKAKP